MRFYRFDRTGKDRKTGASEESLFQGLHPEAVFHEVTEKGANKPGSEVIKKAHWIETIPIKDRTQVGLLMVSLEMG